MARLRFLGCGDSQGVPRWWCNCSVCTDARNGGSNVRTRSSVLLETGSQNILIDSSPELRMQLTRENVQSINLALISHAHNDHLLGLGDLADFARWTGQQVPIFAAAEVLPQVQQRFSYLLHGNYPKIVPMQAIGASMQVAGYRLAALRVPHGHNGYAYGLRFDGATGSWAYIPDSIGIHDKAPWQGLDLLILGVSFYHEAAPYDKRSVYDVTEALELIQELNPKQTIFTHMGHGVDSRKRAPAGTRYGHDGLNVKLP